jgi:hypothetical protein
MALKRKVKSAKNVIPLDGDKLGMIGGMIGAIIVLIMSLFYHNGDITTTLLRVGWAFVICYGATFFLVRMILRTTLQEMVEQQKGEKNAARAAKEKLMEEYEQEQEQAETE